MRNLPFHVAPSAGNYIDVFDRYYRNLVAPSTEPICTNSQGQFIAPVELSSGYVAEGAKRCAWEPTTSFYRTVRWGTVDSDIVGFAVVVDTQMLSDVTPPVVVVPTTGYDTQLVGKDTPPAQQVGVTVTVLPLDRGIRLPLTSYTQISKHTKNTTRASATVDVSAIDVGTTALNDVPLSLAGGILQLAGSLTYASTVDAVLSAAAASTGLGLQASGAAASTSAPPITTRPALEASNGQLDASGCELACWGGNYLSPVTVDATGGLPNAGSPTAPLETGVRQPSASGRAFALAAGAGAPYRPTLNLAPPLLFLKKQSELDGGVGSATSTTCTVQTTGSNIRVGASGWLRSTAATNTADPSLVEACGTARTATIAVLPTSFANGGVIRIQLTRASVRCAVSGLAHAPSTTYDYSAVVERWIGPNQSDYTTVTTVTPASTVDALAALDLETTQVGVFGPLSQWIESWSAVTPDKVLRTTKTGTATLAIPGVVNVVTAPLRRQSDASGGLVLDGEGNPLIDPGSTMSVTVGALACTAEDAR